MTAKEYAEAEHLVGTGTVHSRMLPLLRAALKQCGPHVEPTDWFVVELRQRLEMAQLLAEIGVKADIQQQDELFRFITTGFTTRSTPCVD